MFLGKSKRIEKSLVKLTKRQKGSIQVNKVRNEKGGITLETEKIKKKIVRFYFKRL